MTNRFINICRKLTTRSDHHQHKMSAIIIKRNRIISLGYNSLKTSPKSPHMYKSTHAEWDAMGQLSDEELKDSSIFVFRENKRGQLANAKPCESCFKYIISKGIRKIFFTHESGIQCIELY